MRHVLTLSLLALLLAVPAQAFTAKCPSACSDQECAKPSNCRNVLCACWRGCYSRGISCDEDREPGPSRPPIGVVGGLVTLSVDAAPLFGTGNDGVLDAFEDVTGWQFVTGRTGRVTVTGTWENEQWLVVIADMFAKAGISWTMDPETSTIVIH